MAGLLVAIKREQCELSEVRTPPPSLPNICYELLEEIRRGARWAWGMNHSSCSIHSILFAVSWSFSSSVWHKQTDHRAEASSQNVHGETGLVQVPPETQSLSSTVAYGVALLLGWRKQTLKKKNLKKKKI